MAKIGAPNLRTLNIDDCSDLEDGWPIEPGFLHVESSMRLTTLILHNSVSISSLPFLSALQTFDFYPCDSSLETLHGCLSQAPVVERLRLCRSIQATYDNTQEELPQLPQLCLPALRHVFIFDSFCDAAAVISILPTPTQTLQVHLMKEDRLYLPMESRMIPVWSSSIGFSGTIMKSLKIFSNQLPAPEQGTHSVTLSWSTDSDTGDVTSHIYSPFSVPYHVLGLRDDHLPLVYSAPVVQVADLDPILDQIATVRLKYVDAYPAHDLISTQAPHVDVKSLQNVQHLEIENARFSSDSKAALSVEAWIVSRSVAGTPFRSIAFCGCSVTTKALFERLKTNKLAVLIIGNDWLS
jgi:hypothetical protein